MRSWYTRNQYWKSTRSQYEKLILEIDKKPVYKKPVLTIDEKLVLEINERLVYKKPVYK